VKTGSEIQQSQAETRSQACYQSNENNQKSNPRREERKESAERKPFEAKLIQFGCSIEREKETDKGN